VNKYNLCSYIYVVLLALALPFTFNQGDGSGVHPNKTVGSLSRSQDVANKHRRRLLVSQRTDAQRNTRILEHTMSSRKRRENAARDNLRLSLAHAAAGPRETAMSGDETSLRHRSSDDHDAGVLRCAHRRREAEEHRVVHGLG